MMMPNRIWAGTYPEDTEAGAWSLKQEFESDNQYIRKDLADELARALEWYNDGRDPVVADALDRYRAATEGS